MLLTLSVYCRRIESQRQKIFQDIRRSFLAKYIYSRNINFHQERIKITLFIIIILNLILPIMGSTQLVQGSASSDIQFDLGRKILNHNSHASEIFASEEQGLSSAIKIIDQKDYTPVGLAKLREYNRCLLCRIMEHIQKHQELPIDNSKLVTSRRREATLDKTFYSSEASKEGVNTDISKKWLQTLTEGNLKSRSRVRMRRGTTDKRRRQLYSPLGGYILQIHPNGKVDGTLAPDSHLGIMMIHTVSVGKVRIQSETTRLFLAMSPSGKLYGSAVFDPRRSAFEERLPDRRHCTYSIVTRKGLAYVGLSKRGKPKRGTKITSRNKSAHFLPLDRLA